MQDRKRIMDVAIALFKEKGYDEVKVAEICKEANIAYSTFYYQFKTKGNLLWEYGKGLASVENGIRAAVTEESPVDKLMCMLCTYAKAYEQMGASLLLQYQIQRMQNAERWKEFDAFQTEMSDVYCQLIEMAQKQGEILNMDAPADLYRASCDMAFALYSAWAIAPDQYDFVQYVMSSQELLFQVAPHKRKYSHLTAEG